MPVLPFALESYISRSRPLSSQRVVNMYAEIQPEEVNAKSKVALFGAPGLVEFSEIGGGPIRGLHTMNDLCYAVSGTTLYYVDSAGVGSPIGGGLAPGTRPISMADNGVQLVCVDGVNGFTYNTSTLTWAQIADVDFYASNVVSYNDSYFMFDRKDTNQFFSSTSNDGTNYPALFFASAETQSDRVLAPINHLQQLLIGGSKTIEIWFLAGGSNFPWARYQGAAIQVGLAGPYAWTKLKEQLFFLGGDKVFYRLEGTQPIRASKHGQETAFASYGDVSDAICWGITWEGHDWIFLTFPSANKTWVLDATTGLWHERESWDSAGASLGRWRGNAYTYCYNKHLVGDYLTGQIGYLDASTYTEYGNMIRGLASTPPIHNNGSLVSLGELQILAETGVGSLTLNPQIQLRLSTDGNRTWSVSKYREMGLVGEYKKILRWLGLGSFYEMGIEIQITDACFRAIHAAKYEMESEA